MGEYVGHGTVGEYVPPVGKAPAPPRPPEAHSVVVGENVGHHVGIFSPSFVPPGVGEGIPPLPIGADVVVGGGGRGGKNGSSTGGNVGSNSVDGTGGGVFANIGLVVPIPPPAGTSGDEVGGDNPGGGGISPNRHSVPCIPKLDLIVSVLHVLEKSRRMVYVVGEQLHILLVDVDDCS